MMEVKASQAKHVQFRYEQHTFTVVDDETKSMTLMKRRVEEPLSVFIRRAKMWAEENGCTFKQKHVLATFPDMIEGWVKRDVSVVRLNTFLAGVAYIEPTTGRSVLAFQQVNFDEWVIIGEEPKKRYKKRDGITEAIRCHIQTIRSQTYV